MLNKTYRTSVTQKEQGQEMYIKVTTTDNTL